MVGTRLVLFFMQTSANVFYEIIKIFKTNYSQFTKIVHKKEKTEKKPRVLKDSIATP